LISPQEFKAALGSFATGITIATTGSRGALHGMTANAVMSVSLDPPLVLLSIQRDTRMHTAISLSGNFALSILSASQRDVAEYFANSARPHDDTAFERFPFTYSRTGAPLLEGALAHVDCEIVAQHVAGDHTLFVGRVVGAETASGGDPLLYFRGGFVHQKDARHPNRILPDIAISREAP
jgi:flavin reductase (DIM6/NTAB) family NADH-FMN oxidoreductase RutF